MSTSPSLFELKGKARTLQQQLSCKLHVAQHMIANSYGFTNWQTLSALFSASQLKKKIEPDLFAMPASLIKFIEESEGSASQKEKDDFSKSIYISLDVKDAMDFDVRDDFEEVSYHLFVRSMLLRQWNLYISGDPDFHGIEESEFGGKALQKEELLNLFDYDDFMEIFIFNVAMNERIFRYKGFSPGMTFEKTYALSMERCFFHPNFMWIKGTFIDLDLIPQIKVDGQVVRQNFAGR